MVLQLVFEMFRLPNPSVSDTSYAVVLESMPVDTVEVVLLKSGCGGEFGSTVSSIGINE